ncbi:MAG: carbohydrate kinase family protein, partial [Deltaproteobacteria bacterium]|nr:carbohydrate kinase family protein [Deltaproteobacteria bacterium]
VVAVSTFSQKGLKTRLLERFMTIVCSGSLAFDRLADYSGRFSDHIIPDKIDMLNVCFVTDKVERVHGGTAGNIAYNLYLMGLKTLIVTSVGDDPDGRDYLERLKTWGLDVGQITLVPDKATAGAYIATDKTNNQLIFFNPGAMLVQTGFEPSSLPGPPSDHLAIISPGGFADMERLAARYRETDVRFIFDPGQQIPVFSGQQLLEMLDGSIMLMCNEYELELFLQQTQKKLEDLFQYTTAVLTTMGGQGSRLHTPRGRQHILTVPVEKIGNPTGAGDAYRAGVLAGLSHGEDILSSCRLGATVASFCVEAPGTQSHFFTPGQLLARHFRAFKESPAFLA